jgi:hypothetical protein
MRYVKGFLLLVSVALISPPIALTQSSGSSQGGGVQGTAGAESSNASASLVTGLDLIVLFGGALLIVALALGLRAFIRDSPTTRARGRIEARARAEGRRRARVRT